MKANLRIIPPLYISSSWYILKYFTSAIICHLGLLQNNIETEKHSRNGGVRTSENPLLHKSNKNTGKIVKINFVRMLEINQRLAAILWAFIQENGWISVWTVSSLAFWLALFPMPSPQLHDCLENYTFPTTAAVQRSNTAATRGSRTGLELPKSSFPREQCYLTWLTAPWEAPFSDLPSFDLTLYEEHSVVHWSKNS